MSQIIPAIIAKDIKELKEKIKIVEPYFDIAQLDVMDDVFVPNETYQNIEEIKKIKTSIRWEIHLMVKNPEREIYKWSTLKPKRFIFHYESFLPNISNIQIKTVIQKIKNYGMEAGLAVNPETPILAVEEFLPYLNSVLIMTANPGFGGQNFLEAILPKIKALRGMWPNGNIEVDGGVKIGIARKCVEAGADTLVVGSAILKAENIEKIVEELKKEIL